MAKSRGTKDTAQQPVSINKRVIFNILKETLSAFIFAAMASRVIIIHQRQVTPGGGHYKFHKLQGAHPRVILNNEYENGL